MLDNKTETLIAVAEQKNFTRAAEALSLTQPAVSHQISQLEQSLGAKLVNRKKGELTLTQEGEIAVRYARILTSMDQKMHMEIADSKRNIKKLRIGLTHTSESTFATEVLARYGNEYPNVSITVFTDTIKNLYDMLGNFEIDLAITDGKVSNPSLNSVMIDTDYLVCIMSNNNPLAKHSMITLNELRRERLILRLPTSATRMLFEATLESHNESIDDFNVILEVDNVTTIKDLVQKDFGVSILAKSVCLREVRKKKLTIVPIENLSMARETNIVYHKSFAHTEVLQDITQLYHDTKKHYLV